jgi:hypothetical protein
MNHHSPIVALVFIGTSLFTGCATTVERQGSPEKTAASTQSVTLADCASQRDSCFANDPLFGLFICPAQYNQCTLTASNGLPAQVNQAISDAAACSSADRECLSAASTPTQVAACARTEAQCVASIVQVHLPTVVSGTATCVDDAIKCINSSEMVSDLTTCANNLQSCAVTQVQSVVPPEVGKAIGSISSCQTTLNSCISAASTPADITACSQADANCVANGLGVTLPDVSISGVVKCAQTAADCTLDATTVSAVTACANTLTSCTTEAVGSSAPPPMTCAQKWTGCIAQNPLNFATCDAQLLTCTN